MNSRVIRSKIAANNKSQSTSSKSRSWKSAFAIFGGKLGRIGKALLFPIAVLPIAAILLRVGAELPSDTGFSNFIRQVFLQTGDIIFGNLPIIFAVGVGFGLTKDNRGEAALSALVGMLILTVLMRSGGADLPNQIWSKAFDFHTLFGNRYDAILANNVLNGIIAGSLVAFLYNRFNNVQMPKALGFFSGRRLIPVLAVLGIVFFAVFYAIVFPWIGYVLAKFSESLSNATSNRYANSGIMGVYVFINRLLIPFGLHHIPNTLFWFQFGQHVTAAGLPVYGDINIFLTGAALGNNAGTFQSGFFPMMMFGLPAIVLAFYVSADNKEQKMRVAASLGSAALVSFLTGITEPIEFAFLFASPLLYLVHALLGGFFALITGLFGIQLGFGFSAGLFDYLLSIPKSNAIISANLSGIEAAMANPAWLVVIGLITGAAYFYVAKFMIKKFNIATPGRGTNQIAYETDDGSKSEVVAPGKASAKAAKFVAALGGYGNITSFQNCATRLRYDVKDSAMVDADALKQAGALGVIKVSPTHVQIIVGLDVEILNNEIIKHQPAISTKNK